MFDKKLVSQQKVDVVARSMTDDTLKEKNPFPQFDLCPTLLPYKKTVLS